MRKRVFLLAVSLVVVGQPTLASEQSAKAASDRELHEIVFKNYPPRALAAGEEGPVFFNVTLDKDAHPLACEVTHGSGHPLLDEETCELVVQHATFKAGRDSSGRVLVREKAEGVVNWTLPGHAPAPINLAPVAMNPKTEPMVCRKILKAGTLSSYERTCMVRSEWAKQSDNMKQPFEDLQGRKGSSNCTIAIGGMGSGSSDPPSDAAQC